MNASAANALLKILEEPPANVYFILISSTWRRLLPTLRSRCRVVKLPGPSAQAVREWLAGQGDERMAELLPLAGGAPLRAVEEVRRGHGPALRSLLGELASPGSDPLALAGRWESLLQGKNDSGLSMETLVGVLQKWVFDLAQLKAAGRARYAGKWAEGARALAVRASMAALIRCYNDLIKMRALANHPLNSRLFLEDMAERYLRAVAVRP
jgi:DNA polymerase-3 subunit delta'